MVVHAGPAACGVTTAAAARQRQGLPGLFAGIGREPAGKHDSQQVNQF